MSEDIKTFMPGIKELHIARVGDGTYLLRTDGGVIVTAGVFGQVVKRAREFFDEGIAVDATKKQAAKPVVFEE